VCNPELAAELAKQKQAEVQRLREQNKELLERRWRWLEAHLEWIGWGRRLLSGSVAKDDGLRNTVDAAIAKSYWRTIMNEQPEEH
jgi:hypothetical protein